MAERAFFRDSYGPKLQEMKRVGMLPPGIRQENRQKLDNQIRMAAGRLQLSLIHIYRVPGRIRTEVLELCGHGYQAGSDPPGNIGKGERT